MHVIMGFLISPVISIQQDAKSSKIISCDGGCNRARYIGFLIDGVGIIMVRSNNVCYVRVSLKWSRLYWGFGLKGFVILNFR